MQKRARNHLNKPRKGPDRSLWSRHNESSRRRTCKINTHSQVPILLFSFPLQVTVLSILIYMLQRKQPPEVLCWRNVLEGFVEFPGEHMCQSLFVIGKESVGFMEFMGLLPFIEHLRATASVTKNTGVTNKQHAITTNMVDLTKPMFSFVCKTMPTRL